jgi:uncharacterized protein
MRFVAIFHDAPGMVHARNAKGLARHLAYLRKNVAEILIAGGLREAPEREIVGGLWVMEVKTRARAVELVENDPYFASGCRTYRLLAWAKALEDRTVTL